MGNSGLAGASAMAVTRYSHLHSTPKSSERLVEVEGGVQRHAAQRWAGDG